MLELPVLSLIVSHLDLVVRLSNDMLLTMLPLLSILLSLSPPSSQMKVETEEDEVEEEPKDPSSPIL